MFSTVQIPSGVGFTLIDKSKHYEGTHIVDDNNEYFGKLSGNYNSDDLRILEEVHFTKSIYDRISNSIAKSTYKLVPDITEFIDKYDGNEDLDVFLAKYFQLSEETINDINRRILPKKSDHSLNSL